MKFYTSPKEDGHTSMLFHHFRMICSTNHTLITNHIGSDSKCTPIIFSWNFFFFCSKLYDGQSAHYRHISVTRDTTAAEVVEKALGKFGIQVTTFYLLLTPALFTTGTYSPSPMFSPLLFTIVSMADGRRDSGLSPIMDWSNRLKFLGGTYRAILHLVWTLFDSRSYLCWLNSWLKFQIISGYSDSF